MSKLIMPGVYIKEVDFSTYTSPGDSGTYREWLTYWTETWLTVTGFRIPLEDRLGETKLECERLMQDYYPGPYKLAWTVSNHLYKLDLRFETPYEETLWILKQ